MSYGANEDLRMRFLSVRHGLWHRRRKLIRMHGLGGGIGCGGGGALGWGGVGGWGGWLYGGFSRLSHALIS